MSLNRLLVNARCNGASLASRVVASKRFASSSPSSVLDANVFGSTEYGSRRIVTLIPGDGIGPELTASIQKLFGWLKVPVDFEVVDFHGNDENASERINDAINSLKRNGVGLKGILSTPKGRATRRSLNMELRTNLDLFCNVIECKSPPGLDTRHKNVDMVVIRQNTEAEYSGLEHEISPGVVESLKVISREESLRIAKFAFDYAIVNGRSKVTAVHKANIMKQGDGLFLQCCQEVSQLYPDIVFEGMIVDNTSMQLVSNPQQFDVMVTPNLYGNIVANIGAGLVGGSGVVPGSNFSKKIALFEPGARQVDKDIAGQNIANPIGMIKSSALMLRHIGLDSYAKAIEDGVEAVLKGDVLTKDVGGTATTDEVTQAVMDHIAAQNQ